MSSTHEDVFTRLSVAIEDWSVQIARSHEEISAQMGVARSHLDRLLRAEPGHDGVEDPDSECDAAADAASQERAIAALEAEIARLGAELESARAEAAAAAGNAFAATPNSRTVEDLEEALALARSELAHHSAAADSLAVELRAAEEEIEFLAAQLREAREAGAFPDDSAGDPSVLRAALEMLQMEHAEAQDEIRALKQALDSNGGRTAGTASIDAFDERGHKRRMGEILVEMGVLTEVELKKLLKEQAADPQRRLGALVVEHGYSGEDLVAKILAAQLRLPYQDLKEIEPEPRAVEMVSAHVVRLHHCLPLMEEEGVLTVAMVNPLDLIAIEDLELASGCRVSPVVSTRSQIGELLTRCYPAPA